MPVNYMVQAQVVDLRSDNPRVGDRFYVDTNAWFWATYANVQFAPKPPAQRRVSAYSSYLKRALVSKAELYWCGLSLAELAHQIEKTEYDIFCQATPTPAPILKEYRHNFSYERQRVVQEIQTAWQSVEDMGQPLPSSLTIDAKTVAAGLQQLSQLPLDGYDLFTLQALQASGISQVISDDGDFCMVPGTTLFTANPNVIVSAQAQRKLISR